MTEARWKLTSKASGFTLGEMLIITAIIAILAIALLPQLAMDNRGEEAKERALRYCTREFREKITAFRKDHTGRLPQLVDGKLPQLTSPTDGDGTLKPEGPIGPYFPEGLPANPFNGENSVTLGTGQVYLSTEAGWQYDPETGGVWPNHPGYYER